MQIKQGRCMALKLMCVMAVLFAWNSVFASQEVVYRLKWLPNMSTVGDLYAASKGLFKTRGLDVIIKPGGPERDAIRELELGQADFGVASADQVIRAVSKGAPVVVVAQLFQKNPLQWIYYKDRVFMKGLEDLSGKRLGVTFGKNDEIIMRTLLARARIGLDQVHLFSVRLDYTPFYKGRVDLWPVYVNTQGVEIGSRLSSAGEQIGFFDPNHYGIRFVANSVVTSEQVLKRRPELAKHFLEALMAGWQQALDPRHAGMAMSVVQQYDKDSSMAVLRAQLEATRKLVLPANNAAIGTIDRSAWQQTEKIMFDHGLIKKPVNIADRLKPIKMLVPKHND